MKIARKSRIQLPISFVVVLFGLSRQGLPYSFESVLTFCAALLIALFCCFNALLDHKQMIGPERIAAVMWFAILLILTPYTIWHTAHIETFHSR